MTELKTYQVYATSLHADIEAAANDGLPRREVLIAWLDDFLLRAKKRGFEMAPADVDNLTALDQFVRFNLITATARAPLE
jgi:hypothetical protein